MLSRLICGNNPFNGNSHLSGFGSREMQAYYTPDQVHRTLHRCQEVGVNCWQSGPGNIDQYQRLADSGGRMHFISLSGDDPACIDTLAKAGCIGIAHHGETTDQLFKRGQLDRMHDYLKRIRAAGLLVGVSTHMPAVVEAVESKGWDVDFYMTCVYERHRNSEELTRLLGHAPIPVSEVYLCDDPPRMFKAMAQTARPCLAFKILAAGRLCDRPEWVERAFKDTFAAIGAKDAVIVGIYDRYSDQAAECAALVKRFGQTPAGIAGT